MNEKFLLILQNMNVEALYEAYRAYENWVATHPNATAAQKNEANDISQSKEFQRWIFNNADGTLEQYINKLESEQAYYKSSQYQINLLESQVYNQSETIASLNQEVSNLKNELSCLQDENEYYEHYNTVWFTTSVIFFILSAVLVLVLYKRTTIIQYITAKHSKN